MAKAGRPKKSGRIDVSAEIAEMADMVLAGKRKGTAAREIAERLEKRFVDGRRQLLLSRYNEDEAGHLAAARRRSAPRGQPARAAALPPSLREMSQEIEEITQRYLDDHEAMAEVRRFEDELLFDSRVEQYVQQEAERRGLPPLDNFDLTLLLAEIHRRRG